MRWREKRGAGPGYDLVRTASYRGRAGTETAFCYRLTEEPLHRLRVRVGGSTVVLDRKVETFDDAKRLCRRRELRTVEDGRRARKARRRGPNKGHEGLDFNGYPVGQVARWMGFHGWSRGEVKRAMLRLRQDGHLEKMPRPGTFFVPFYEGRRMAQGLESKPLPELKPSEVETLEAYRPKREEDGAAAAV